MLNLGNRIIEALRNVQDPDHYPNEMSRTVSDHSQLKFKRQSHKHQPFSLSVTGKWRNWPETIFLSASIALAFDATQDGFGVMTSHTRVSFGFLPIATTLNAMS